MVIKKKENEKMDWKKKVMNTAVFLFLLLFILGIRWFISLILTPEEKIQWDEKI